MDDVIGLILVAIFYLISAASAKKKKKAKRRKNEDTAQAVGRAFEKAIQEAKRRQEAGRQEKWPEAAQDAERKAGHAAAPAMSNSRETPAAEPLCESRPIHLHDVSDEQMISAGEGEDPCHQGGIQTDVHAQQEEQMHRAYETDSPDADDAAAQDLLRGVIMSEILARPAQRRQASRYGWRA